MPSAASSARGRITPTSPRSGFSESHVRIRSYVPPDFEALYQMDQLCFPAGIAYSRSDLRAYARLSGAETLVAEVNNAVAGGFLMSAYRRAVGRIITLDVLPELRRLRIGTLLLEEAETRLRQNGVREILLETAVNNVSGVAFWNKHGYRVEGILKNYYPGALSAYAMIKSLI